MSDKPKQSETMRPLVIGLLNDLWFGAGWALMFYGLWLIYRPAAFIFSGAMTMALAVARARR